MTWEPKQGEIVNYDCYYNNGACSFTGLFVSAYKDKYIVDEGGRFYTADVIKPIFIEKEKELGITIGSVWQINNNFNVVIEVGETSIWAYNPQQAQGFIYRKDHFLKNLKPRPDKIGMAPCVYGLKSGFTEPHYRISDVIFSLGEGAADYYNDVNTRFISWPANNSMWVIVNK